MPTQHLWGLGHDEVWEQGSTQGIQPQNPSEKPARSF